MKYQFCHLQKNAKKQKEAAQILTKTFNEINKDAWPTYQSAMQEIYECIEEPNICLGICIDEKLIGWVGLRPMYDKVWELHPMVISKEYQNRGIGRKLIKKLEELAREKGIIGIVLGTDDETGSTSISNIEINSKNIWNHVKSIRNIKNHPFEFYQKCRYFIVGVIPDANGKGKPDIWMWKSLN